MHAYWVLAVALLCIAAGALIVWGVVMPFFRRRERAQQAVPAATGEPTTEAAQPSVTAADGAATAPSAPPAAEAAGEDADLEQRRQRAERAEQLRNLLVSKMSHDIRTPLNSVITLSQLLTEGNAGPLSFEQRKYIEIIHRSGQTLLSLISDILDLASIEAGRLEVEVVPFDLRAVARAVAETCEPLARKKGLPLHLNLPRRAVLARGDEERLRHVLAALAEHAVHETRNGYVELSIDADDKQALVRVSDTGAGLSAEARNAMFDDFLAGLGPFAERPAPPLPLVVAGRMVTLMGGSIAIDSVVGDGTTFTVSLPLAGDDAVPRARDREDEPSAIETASGHILLIEDDEIERRRVGSLLEAAGYDVATASSGQEGLTLLRAGHYDAVVLDLVMPGMSGLDVLRAARTEERLAGTPFIVLSALYMTKSERDVLGPAVAGVVRKGETTAEELTAQLRRALRAAGAPSAERPVVSSGATRRARVLIVEDNLDNLFTIKQVLASLPVVIETAASGPEAVESCRHNPPDLIMMDVELPGMSGLEASRAIRALPDCRHIPIIALTADAMQGDRERVLAAQCSDYLAKPVQPLDVVSAVTRALQLETH